MVLLILIDMKICLLYDNEVIYIYLTRPSLKLSKLQSEYLYIR